ncbi:MAG: hypothetical protein EZS28_019788 [Streblomastix strix]|uniref:Uncharacterized protein n=1 Tax=Streblomastix strix TaxID=222440 RepID=A0A5J4VQ09_9EUKA|nr:MAG: hypothetical protein EZS28_019788 [Streblomastix strix]
MRSARTWRQIHWTLTKQQRHQKKYYRKRQQQHGRSWLDSRGKKRHRLIFTLNILQKSKSQKLDNAQVQPQIWGREKKPRKHNNAQALLMLAFDQVLAELETKLLPQYRLLHGTLTQIVKRDWIATLKFNLCSFISMYDSTQMVNMMRALMDTTDQGYLLKTQKPTVMHLWYNNQMLKSLRALPQTERAHPASVDTLLTRIVVFSGELGQELKMLTSQQVIDLIRYKPEIMPPE